MSPLDADASKLFISCLKILIVCSFSSSFFFLFLSCLPPPPGDFGSGSNSYSPTTLSFPPRARSLAPRSSLKPPLTLPRPFSSRFFSLANPRLPSPTGGVDRSAFFQSLAQFFNLVFFSHLILQLVAFVVHHFLLESRVSRFQSEQLLAKFIAFGFCQFSSLDFSLLSSKANSFAAAAAAADYYYLRLLSPKQSQHRRYY